MAAYVFLGTYVTRTCARPPCWQEGWETAMAVLNAFTQNVLYPEVPLLKTTAQMPVTDLIWISQKENT